jgi:hypothetical protein
LLQNISKSGTLAADTWRAVLDLLSLPQTAKVRIVEGFLQVQDNGLTFRLINEGEPAPTGSTGVGIARAKDSMSTFGPASGRYRGYPLDRLWVRNTTAGSNGSVVLECVAEVD